MSATPSRLVPRARSWPARLACRIPALLAMALMAGCGGGAGAPAAETAASPVITVRTSPARLDLRTVAGRDVTVTLSATLDPVPAERVYPVLVADRPVIVPGPAGVLRQPDGSYRTIVTTDRALPPGTHTGTLTLDLCRNPACTDAWALRGASLPYTITVEPPVVLSVQVDGATTPARDIHDIVLKAGTLVRVTASLPVRWSQGSSMGGTLTTVSSTPQAWTGRVQGRFGNFVGLLAQSASGVSNGDQAIFTITD